MSAPSPGLLSIDCGNTTVDCFWHPDGRRRRFPSSENFGEPLAAFVRSIPVAHCVGATVVAASAELVAATLASCRVPLAWAGRELPCPLRLDYDRPHTLGADRWLGALAAHRRFGRAIVVDCGTATTVNLVDDDGTFRGGAIGPGLRALLVGMAALTPALPMPELDAEPVMPARSSHAAVHCGVLLGYCGLVERLVASAVAHAGGSVQLVVTGGNAPRFLRHTRLRPHHEPALVHHGLRRLWEESACTS